MHSTCHAPGCASGESFCAKLIPVMPWLCIPAHERGTRLWPPSPPSQLLCSASWRFEWPQQRTCSACRGRKRSCITSTAIRRSNRPGCLCHAHRRRSGRFCASPVASPRIAGAGPNCWSCASPGRKSSSTSKMKASSALIPRASESRVVEIANFVDAGTSIWLHRQVRSDFDAETLLEVVVQFLRERGLPQGLTFDNDPRFVGSALGRDFPSAKVALPLVCGSDAQRHPAASARQKCLRRTLSSLAWRGVFTGTSARHALGGL
jgi:hypothetical protein